MSESPEFAQAINDELADELENVGRRLIAAATKLRRSEDAPE